MQTLSVDFPVKILTEDFVASCEVTITARAYAGRRPDMNQPGEPPEPMEFDVTLEKLCADGPNWKNNPALETPEWLRREIVNFILEDADCYEQIEREAGGYYD